MVQRGYVHPDEFFQSPEPAAQLVFGFETFTPWEFSEQHACRSIAIPYITSHHISTAFFFFEKRKKTVVLNSCIANPPTAF